MKQLTVPNRLFDLVRHELKGRGVKYWVNTNAYGASVLATRPCKLARKLSTKRPVKVSRGWYYWFPKDGKESV